MLLRHLAARAALTIALLSFSTSTLAGQTAASVSYGEAERELRARNEARAFTLSDPMHAPVLYSHGERRPCVVVVTHGTFESPRFIRGISRAFFDLGCNVSAILLPGHWDRDLQSIDEVSRQIWTSELASAIVAARPLGDRLILAGYSLGGLLSVLYALGHPDEVAALAVWAPALKLTGAAAFVTAIGSIFGIAGNEVLGDIADGHETPYLSPHAGELVLQLIEDLQRRFGVAALAPDWSVNDEMRATAYRKLRTPTFLTYSRSDEAVSWREMELFRSSVSGEIEPVIFDFDIQIRHGVVAKTPMDTYSFSPRSFNPEWESVLSRLGAFMERQGVLR